MEHLGLGFEDLRFEVPCANLRRACCGSRRAVSPPTACRARLVAAGRSPHGRAALPAAEPRTPPWRSPINGVGFGG